MSANPIRLAMVRLTDAAPIVLAQTQGMFAAEGLDVSITVEPSWANVADKLAWGLIEGAVLLQPLAIAMTLGLRDPTTPLVIPCNISLNGNSITLARHLADPILAGNRPTAATAATRLRHALTTPARLRLGVVHAFSTHDLLLRLWLDQAGIDPETEADIVVVPPQDAVAALAAGTIDGFCAGAPWGAVAAHQGAGRTVAVTSAIRPDHPEKALALREDWANANPAALLALIRATRRAALACDRPATAPALAALLARPEWLGVPAPLVAASLPGGTGGDVDRSTFAATTPTPEHATWLIQQMSRWRRLPVDALHRATQIYRPGLYDAASRAAPTAGTPTDPPQAPPPPTSTPLPPDKPAS